MYIAYSLLIGFEMPNEYDAMEKFKAENEGFTETVTTSNYIMFQKTSRIVSSLPIKVGDAKMGDLIDKKESRLKPCPFCGHEAVIDDCGDYRYFVRCTHCSINQDKLYAQRCDAVRAWNRRMNDE